MITARPQRASRGGCPSPQPSHSPCRSCSPAAAGRKTKRRRPDLSSSPRWRTRPAAPTVRFRRRLRPRYETDIGFRIGGKIIERLVEVGQNVKAGSPLHASTLPTTRSRRPPQPIWSAPPRSMPTRPGPTRRASPACWPTTRSGRRPRAPEGSRRCGRRALRAGHPPVGAGTQSRRLYDPGGALRRRHHRLEDGSRAGHRRGPAGGSLARTTELEVVADLPEHLVRARNRQGERRARGIAPAHVSC